MYDEIGAIRRRNGGWQQQPRSDAEPGGTPESGAHELTSSIEQQTFHHRFGAGAILAH
jgi:hypothetical protein